MKKSMKKVTAMTMAAMMAALLGACGSSSSETTAAATTAKAEETTAAASEVGSTEASACKPGTEPGKEYFDPRHGCRNGSDVLH